MIIRIAENLLVYVFLGWLLCDIDPNPNPNKEYTWYSGIWHGLFFNYSSDMHPPKKQICLYFMI